MAVGFEKGDVKVFEIDWKNKALLNEKAFDNNQKHGGRVNRVKFRPFQEKGKF